MKQANWCCQQMSFRLLNVTILCAHYRLLGDPHALAVRQALPERCQTQFNITVYGANLFWRQHQRRAFHRLVHVEQFALHQIRRRQSVSKITETTLLLIWVKLSCPDPPSRRLAALP